MQQRVETVLKHPLHRYLGLDYIDSDQGEATLGFVVNENTLNPAGVLHGGVVYTLCDVCAYAGLLSMLGEDEEAVTHDIHISALRSAKLGDAVKIRSSLIKRGRTLCFIDVTAEVEGKLIATARVTKSILRA